MAIEQILSDWGLPAIFLGTVLEGDAVAFLGGVLAHRRILPFDAVALAAAAGAVLVDQVMFQIGRHLARFPRVRHLLARPAARQVFGWIDRRPALFCLVFRFLYGLKTVGALALGASSVPTRRFVALDLAGCLVWAHALAALGFGAGQAIERLFGRLAVHNHIALGVAAAIVLLAAGAAVRRARRLRGDAP